MRQRDGPAWGYGRLKKHDGRVFSTRSRPLVAAGGCRSARLAWAVGPWPVADSLLSSATTRSHPVRRYAREFRSPSLTFPSRDPLCHPQTLVRDELGLCPDSVSSKASTIVLLAQGSLNAALPSQISAFSPQSLACITTLPGRLKCAGSVTSHANLRCGRAGSSRSLSAQRQECNRTIAILVLQLTSDPIPLPSPPLHDGMPSIVTEHLLDAITWAADPSATARHQHHRVGGHLHQTIALIGPTVPGLWCVSYFMLLPLWARPAYRCSLCFPKMSFSV